MTHGESSARAPVCAKLGLSLIFVTDITPLFFLGVMLKKPVYQGAVGNILVLGKVEGCCIVVYV